MLGAIACPRNAVYGFAQAATKGWTASITIGSLIIAVAGPTAASALMMVYAAWTKGSTALLIAIEQTASAKRIADVLHDEWNLSQPGLRDRLPAAQREADAKGWRWEGEMR